MSQPVHIDVRRTAALARLRLTPEEEAAYAGQLDHVLAYIAKLDEVDVSGVNLAVTESANAFTRPDAARPSQDVEAALLNAPRRSGDQFLVPKVVE